MCSRVSWKRGLSTVLGGIPGSTLTRDKVVMVLKPPHKQASWSSNRRFIYLFIFQVFENKRRAQLIPELSNTTSHKLMLSLREQESQKWTRNPTAKIWVKPGAQRSCQESPISFLLLQGQVFQLCPSTHSHFLLWDLLVALCKTKLFPEKKN